MAADPIKLAVARTAHGLADGYYAFLVAHLVAVNPLSINSLPPAKVLGGIRPGRSIERTARFTLSISGFISTCFARITTSKGTSFAPGRWARY